MKICCVLNVVRVVLVLGVGIGAVCFDVFGTVVPRRMVWELLWKFEEIDGDRLHYMQDYLPGVLVRIVFLNLLAIAVLTFLALLPYFREKKDIRAEHIDTEDTVD